MKKTWGQFVNDVCKSLGSIFILCNALFWLFRGLPPPPLPPTTKNKNEDTGGGGRIIL